MLDADCLLEFANQLFAAQAGDALNNVQRRVLLEALINGFKTKTYDQIAAETGYSGAYIRNIIARSLWKSFSEILEKKVTRRNIRTLLLEQSKADATGLLPEVEVSRESEAVAEGIVEPDADDNTSPQRLSSSVPWILVVDDQPHNLELLTHMLEEEGYQVWSATNGADALKLVVMARPNLILLDVNMPGMNGYEVCRQLKADPQTQFIPVIFISALDEAWDKVQAFSVGGIDYITKPFNTLETLVRIDHQIQIGATQAQLSILDAQTSKTDPSHPPSPPTATLQDASVDELSATKASIMVVDDDPKSLSLLADLLKEEGFDIWQATTGAEVLKFAPTLLPDLMLLDINLPDMSGYNVCQQLRENEQTKLIPVIFVSALDATWDQLKGFAAGGNDYVTKPLKILELVCRIRNQLRLGQLRAQLSRWNAQSAD